ncbi:MAG: hypothetical protein ABI186_04155 [Candidatus Elarobacter sp.]
MNPPEPVIPDPQPPAQDPGAPVDDPPDPNLPAEYQARRVR